MIKLKKVIASVSALALALALPAAPALAQFSQQNQWGVCGGTPNAQTITIMNVASLADLVGVSIACISAAPNTGSTTLSVNGLAPTLIKTPAPAGIANLNGGEINGPIVYLYDGTEFVIVSKNYGQVIPPHNLWSQTVHGTYTFTVPPGIFWINVTVVGGGGGGSPGGGGSFSNMSGGGGGGAGTAQGWVNVVPGQTITATVGQGGAGSAANNVQAGSGGNSSFGALSGTGGLGAYFIQGAQSAGGSGGAGSGGQINLTGGVGGDGNTTVAWIQGGGGGASSQGGGGRTSTLGLPARPDVINGAAPGSGGGGVWGGSTTNQQGGNGADGLVSASY